MSYSGLQPAIALVDDDYHSARLMTRMLAAHGCDSVERLETPEQALAALAMGAATGANRMVLVDLKSSSDAPRNFVARLHELAPSLVIAAMAPSLDPDSRDLLLDAGADAVFERHADINRYREEAASIVAFWVRNQRLDAVGT